MKRQRREVLAALTAAVGSTLLPISSAGEQTPSPNASASPKANSNTKPTAKETVTGIGGFFFRAHDPKALEQWYLEHLGINLVPKSYSDTPWTQQAGVTAFSPFPETTKYFGDPTKQWMLNFRVANLDRMVAQLAAAGIPAKVHPETYPNGRFARIHDPEGNPIELWQPMEPPKSK